MADDLPTRVAERFRAEEAAVDPRLERLAAGTLSAEAKVELEAAAARDPALAEQLRLYRPLSTALQAKLTLQAMGGGRRPAKVVPLRPAVWLIPLAMAALALLVLWPRGPAALPGYAGRVEGGDLVERGAAVPVASPTRALSAGSLLTLELRPERPVEGPVAARAYVRSAARAWVAPGVPEVDPGGAVRLRGRAGEVLGVVTGTVTVVLMVARPDALPTPPEAFAPGAGPRLLVTVSLR